ncbi:MAG: imelysin family protein [Bacteroidota bacterium]|nr:imelysin family protein [Bacteroidota bacterium]MDP4234044.1 imelysin family protein [Bacteroidota bacterium]MDP4242910.1 imelysin family protein [Bacteroidota bacterium]MDP4287651.1 imelysin family protein [Bacteroidota bacterium]
MTTMRSRTMLLSIVPFSALLFASCSSPTGPTISPSPHNSVVLTDLADRFFVPTYSEFDQRATTFDQSIMVLQSSPTDANLQNSRDAWRVMRSAWEHCYACNIGDIATNATAPTIDPWPVAYDRIDSLLEGTAPINSQSLAGWEEDLRGFHAIEYVLFGSNGSKLAHDLSPRALQYLLVLANDVMATASQIRSSWDSATSGSYYRSFVDAGSGSDLYPTQRAALLDVTTAISGMCDDLANKGIGLPYQSGNPLLDPSPFSGNTVSEFAARLRGARDVYTGGGATTGHGLSMLLSSGDSALDREIRSGFDTAIARVSAIPSPFGTAILDRSPLVPTAVDAITSLEDLLNSKLVPIIQKEEN